MDIAHLGRQAGMYALFGTDGYLYLAQAGGAPVPAAHLSGISTEGQIKLYVHEPWVCVTERFSTHAALVHLEKASVREMSREDYHAGVSSYSIGFLERGGRVLLICQTEWNRLDIVDAATGECLTDREAHLRKTSSGRGGGGEGTPNGYDEENDIDYFHSLLHVSPDGEYFLSNGWIWHPMGQIICFRTDDFLERFEQSRISMDDWSDYNWDRPCAFIGSDRFVIAADDMRKSNPMSAKELEGYAYKQLQLYRLNKPDAQSGQGEHTLTKEREVSCGAFWPDEDGRVHGELVWDAACGALVAITAGGAFALSLDGEVLESLPECAGWHYSPEHHVLYRWSQEEEKVEERRFACMG